VFQCINDHPYLFSVVSTWIFTNIITALVSNLPAPTKESTVKYTYWFKVANTIVGNISRAGNTAVELSPNWNDAIERHVATMARLKEASKP
jgi:hypothetical protein